MQRNSLPVSVFVAVGLYDTQGTDGLSPLRVQRHQIERTWGSCQEKGKTSPTNATVHATVRLSIHYALPRLKLLPPLCPTCRTRYRSCFRGFAKYTTTCRSLPNSASQLVTCVHTCCACAMQLLAFIATSFHQLSYLYIFQIHLCGLSGRLQTRLVEPIAQQAQHHQPMAAYVERLRFWICGKHMQ